MDEVLTGVCVSNEEQAKAAARSTYHLFFGERPPLIVDKIICFKDRGGVNYSVICLLPRGCKINVSDKGAVLITPGGCCRISGK